MKYSLQLLNRSSSWNGRGVHLPSVLNKNIQRPSPIKTVSKGKHCSGYTQEEHQPLLACLLALFPLVFGVSKRVLGEVFRRLEDLALINGEELPSVASPGLVDGSSDGTFKYLLYPPVAKGRALQVALCFHILGQSLPFYGINTGGPVGPHLPLVSLGGHHQHGGTRQVTPDFSYPLVLQVQKGVLVGHRVAHQDHISLLVGQGTDASEGVVASCVPETQTDLDTVHEDVHTSVLVHCGLIGLREGL